MSDAFQTHGAFSWCELQTDDEDKAKSFYSDVIGWETEPMEMSNGGTYTGGEPVGGIMKRPPEMSNLPQRWASYITVDDVDERAQKAADAGARVLAPPFDVPGVGRIATLQDPMGALISFITYEKKD